MNLNILLVVLIATTFSAEVNAANLDDCQVDLSMHPAPVINVNDAGIHEALNAIKQAGTGTLWFPAGKYVFGKHGENAYFKLDDMHHISIVGQGEDSELILAQPESQGGRQGRILNIFDSSYLSISCLKFNGSRNLFSDINEQQNNIFIRRSKNIVISNITSVNAFGDGLNIGDAENVLIVDSDFDNNERNGVTIGHGVSREIRIIGNYFGSGIDTQQIDFEHGEYSKVTIADNKFQKMLPEDVFNRDQYSVALTRVDEAAVTGNSVENPFLIRNSNNVFFSQNENVDQFTIDRDSKHIRVEDNKFRIWMRNRKGNKMLAGFLVIGRQGDYPDHIEVENNSFTFVGGMSKKILIHNVKTLALKNNLFFNESSKADANDVRAGISLVAQSIDMLANVFNNRTVRSRTSYETKVSVRNIADSKVMIIGEGIEE